MDVKKTSHFRRWVYNLWDDSCQERLTWRQQPATMQEYWNTNKYWLKHEYVNQRKGNGVSKAC